MKSNRYREEGTNIPGFKEFLPTTVATAITTAAERFRAEAGKEVGLILPTLDDTARPDETQHSISLRFTAVYEDIRYHSDVLSRNRTLKDAFVKEVKSQGFELYERRR